MRRRFFVDHFENQHASMHGDLAHHVGRVLRAQPGQLYELSDGTTLWLSKIEAVTKDRVDFALLEQLQTHIPQLHTTLLLSIVKFDAFEWALEKATELGVSRIVPIAATRSEKALVAAAVKRAGRWQKILLESSQQSRRVQLPVLAPLTKPEAGFAAPTDSIKILLSESPKAQPLRRLLSAHQSPSATLAIGPEGGWTDAEFADARASSFLEASLGQLILRTETAVIAALANLNFALSPD
jgi:16S rRNA (uracil1498-N3)-methyltransferase